MVSDRDKGVRAAALALLQTLYQLAGPSQTWGLLGKLTSQQQSLIEERFKHREKSSASASPYPTPRAMLLLIMQWQGASQP